MGAREDRAREDDPKIKIDSDWKREAAETKARLRESESAEPKGPDELGGGPYPPASFSYFLLSLSTQALIALGEIEHPATNRKEADLEQARFTIDLLEVLREKTEGNRTEEETRSLEALLFDLKMRYVEISGSGRGGDEPPKA